MSKRGLKKIVKNNKLILKRQQRFKRHNAFTEEINKSVLSSNDDKRMQSISSLIMEQDLVCKKEEIKCNKIIKQYKNI